MWPGRASAERHREIVELLSALRSQGEKAGATIERQVEKILKTAEQQVDKVFSAEAALFTIYREYLAHEDDLINNRLNWNFTIQGFLFTSYTLSLQKIADMKLALLSSSVVADRIAGLKITHTLYDLQLLLAAITIVGIGVSFFVYLSVYAARLAITELAIHWSEVNKDKGWPPQVTELSPIEYARAILKKKKLHGPVPPGLPGLIGGGNLAANIMGFHAPSGLPLVLIAVWVFLLVDACRELIG